MSKEIKGYIKLTIGAGKANPAPPIGPALGQKKVSIMDFCKAFNAATSTMTPATPIPTVITVYADNSFTFITKTSPASYYLKQFAGISTGSKATKKEPAIGKVTMAQCREIAKIKMPDLNTNDLEAGARMIRGTAEAMGITVEGV